MKSPGTEEKILVDEARNGSRESFEELVHRYAPRVSALVYQHVADADATLDISQTAFLKAYRQIRSLRDAERFQPWLFRIAVNESLRFLKQKTRERSKMKLTTEGLEELQATGPTPVDSLVSEEERASVIAALDDLPPQQRTTFVLRHFQGLSTAESANVLSCSTSAVKANLSYALKSLRKKLARGEGDE